MPRNLITLMLLSGAAPAFAQQTANNAVTQSEDAFGRVSGGERIGIYSNEDVRGFSPTEAGNNRLEGLYIDQQGITSPRLIDSISIRVGYAARGTPFPAPTGILDLRIEKFTGETGGSAQVEWENYANKAAAVEAKVALSGEKLGLALGFGVREADQVQFRNGSFRNYLVGMSWLPKKGSEFIVFSGGFSGRGGEMAASIFPAGSALPPEQPRKLQQTQPWALNRNSGSVTGVIAKTNLAQSLRLEAGLFYTVREEQERFVTLLLGTEPTGFVRDHVILADQGNSIHATSGEFRLIQTWTGSKLRHSVIASVRGRDQNRIYGGQQRISLGASRAGIQDFRPKPILAFGPKDESIVRQMTYGLQYNLLSTGGSSLSLAVQKANYTKHTNFANAALTDTISRDAPWLMSANGALVVAPRLTVYGGYVRGLEESAVAPDIATNRNEAPPAIRTRQMDLGMRYAITPKLALIAGVFEVKKPYFGVDAASRFGNLGTVANRGVEVSLAGALAKGLTVIAGGILVNPKISGTEVDAGRIGKHPIGSFRKRGIFNLDWKPVGQEAWSFDLAFEGVSSETANRLNSLNTPARTNFNLGTRYRFNLAGSKVMLRGQILNLFNSYGWRVSSSGGFGTTPPRILYLQAVVDF